VFIKKKDYVKSTPPIYGWGRSMGTIVEYWLSGKNGLWYYHIIEADGTIVRSTDGLLNKNQCLDTIHNLNTSGKHMIIRELKPQRNISRTCTSLFISEELPNAC
jgi:hypothetical protein